MKKPPTKQPPKPAPKTAPKPVPKNDPRVMLSLMRGDRSGKPSQKKS